MKICYKMWATLSKGETIYINQFILHAIGLLVAIPYYQVYGLDNPTKRAKQENHFVLL